MENNDLRNKIATDIYINTIKIDNDTISHIDSDNYLTFYQEHCKNIAKLSFICANQFIKVLELKDNNKIKG